MYLLINLLPLITSILLGIYTFIVKKWLENQFSIKLENEKLKLEIKYSLIKIEKEKLITYLENFHKELKLIERCFRENQSDPKIKSQINNHYVKLTDLSDHLCRHSAFDFLKTSTCFANGEEFVDFYKNHYDDFKNLINKIARVLDEQVSH